MEPIVNRVEESDIIVFNLEDLWDDRPVVELDLEPFLYEGLMVREKVFRDRAKEFDWSSYQDRHVAIFCSSDAIVPTWAYMLVATRLEGIAASVAFGRRDDLIRDYFVRAMENVDWSQYTARPVVVKGCGSKLIPPNAYVLATQKLQGVASKLMYGEPCSSVPLWRRKSEAPPPNRAVKPAIPAALGRK